MLVKRALVSVTAKTLTTPFAMDANATVITLMDIEKSIQVSDGHIMKCLRLFNEQQIEMLTLIVIMITTFVDEFKVRIA